MAYRTAMRLQTISICGIPYFLSKEVARIDDLAHRKTGDIRALGIELLLEHTAERVDPNGQRVLTRDRAGTVSDHIYDKLVIGTGANSIRPQIPGLVLPGVFLPRWIGDTLAFDEFLTRNAPKHVVIVGGGYIGLEMAEALRLRGFDVTIIEMAASVMTTIDLDLGKKVGAELERNGVRLVMSTDFNALQAEQWAAQQGTSVNEAATLFDSSAYQCHQLNTGRKTNYADRRFEVGHFLRIRRKQPCYRTRPINWLGVEK